MVAKQFAEIAFAAALIALMVYFAIEVSLWALFFLAIIVIVLANGYLRGNFGRRE
jgi:hypothetical protein